MTKNGQSKIFLNNSLKSSDTLNLARYYRFKGGFLEKNIIYDSSFYYYLKSEKFYERTDNIFELSKLYLNLSRLIFRKDDYLNAERFLTKSKIFYFKQNKKDYIHEYNIFNHKSNIDHNLKNYDKAILNQNKALKLIKKNHIIGYNNSNLIGTCYNNIGNVFRERKLFNKAIYYLREGLKEKYLLKNDPELYACLLNNLGNCYLNSKNYKNSPNLFIKAERIFDSLNIQNEQSISNIYLSNYYCKIKDTLKAITYCKKSLQIAKQSKANNYYFDCP